MYTNSWDPNNGQIMISTDYGSTWSISPLPFKVGGNMPGRGVGEVTVSSFGRERAILIFAFSISVWLLTQTVTTSYSSVHGVDMASGSQATLELAGHKSLLYLILVRSGIFRTPSLDLTYVSRHIHTRPD